MKSPIKFSWQTELWPCLLLILIIGLSLWSYPQLPARVITHWNIYGYADGWGSKIFQTIFFPGFLIAIYILFGFLPSLDPNKDRYKEFSSVYLIIRNLILTTLSIIFVAVIFSNLNYQVNIGAISAGTIGLMMFVLGNYLGKLKRNWFVGIKSPWTLSSENVWNKTHRLAGKLFMIWGLGIMIAPWLKSNLVMGVLFGGIIMIVIFINIYSYLLFKKEKNQIK